MLDDLLVSEHKFDSNVLMLTSKIFSKNLEEEEKSHCLLLLSIHTTKANISQEADTLHRTIRRQPRRKGWVLGTAPEGKCFLERTHCC